MTYNSNCFSNVESKTIRCPFGDQFGEPINGASSVVNCVAFKPSLSATQRFGCPERLEVNSIFLPSGEYWAAQSNLVEAISFTGRAPAFCRSRRQISASMRKSL